MQASADYRDGSLKLQLFGELDHYSASTTLRIIESAIEEYLPRQCELDLCGLNFMDSSGIAVLLKTEGMMRQTGGGVIVTRANEQIRRVVRLSGLGGMLRGEDKIKECETVHEC